MTKQHVRNATITGTLTDYLPVTGINGDGSTFQAYFLQVKLATIDLDQGEWEWPKLHEVYLVLDDLISEAPTLGDRIVAFGELSLTHFALDGHGMATASAVKALYQRELLYADNWSEVNLVDGPRRLFEAQTVQYADSPWQFDEWLNKQVELLPDNAALEQLQALLLNIAQQRSELYSKAAPVTALMQDPSQTDITRGGLFQPLVLGHWESELQLVRRYDENDKKLLHKSLLKQSAELARREELRKKL